MSASAPGTPTPSPVSPAAATGPAAPSLMRLDDFLARVRLDLDRTIGDGQADPRLVASFHASGVLSAMVVSAAWVLIDGHRRVAALKRYQAELRAEHGGRYDVMVPVRVAAEVDSDTKQRIAVLAAEVRKNRHPIDQAYNLRAIQESLTGADGKAPTLDTLHGVTGLSKATLCRAFQSLSDFSPETIRLVEADRLSQKSLLALRKLPTVEARASLAKTAADHNWSEEQVKAEVKARLRTRSLGPKGKAARPDPKVYREPGLVVSVFEGEVHDLEKGFAAILRRIRERIKDRRKQVPGVAEVPDDDAAPPPPAADSSADTPGEKGVAA